MIAPLSHDHMKDWDNMIAGGHEEGRAALSLVWLAYERLEAKTIEYQRLQQRLQQRLLQQDLGRQEARWSAVRTVSSDLALHYNRKILILDPTPLTRSLVGKKVEVMTYPDGRLTLQFNQMTLDFKVFDKIAPGGTVRVDNKRLSAVLELIKARQAARQRSKRRRTVARTTVKRT